MVTTHGAERPLQGDHMTDLHQSLTDRMAKIHKLLAFIADKSSATANDPLADWGYVGSLGHVAEKLKGIAEFLGYEEED
jgi:hypothetical protein